MNYPCKNCEKRHPGCHDHCEDYKSVADYRAKEREDLRQRRAIDDAMYVNRRFRTPFNPKEWK